MTERRLALLCGLLCGLLCSALEAGANPPKAENLFAPGADLRVFYGSPALAGVVEAEARRELANRTYRSYRAGVTGILLDGRDWVLKGGVSLWREYGALLETDWRKIDGNWRWADSDARASDAISADLTPRMRIAENLVADLRVRYQHGIGNDPRRSFKIRPGLQYSIRDGGAPFLESLLHVEAYLNLNGRASNPYEVWTYASVLWHAWHDVLVGPKLAFRGSTFAGETGQGPYEISSTTWALSLVGIVTFH